MLANIIGNLLAALIFFVLGILASKAYSYYRNYYFYNLFRPGWARVPKPTIVLESIPIDPEHAKKAIGDGCVDALISILPLLRHVSPNRLLCQCKDVNNEIRKKDLILIGGPMYNTFTAQIFDQLRDKMALKYDGYAVVDHVTGTKYEAEVKDQFIVKDYSLITRISNPFNPERVILLIGGSRTCSLSIGGMVLSSRELLRRIPRDKKVHEFQCIFESEIKDSIVQGPILKVLRPISTQL